MSDGYIRYSFEKIGNGLKKAGWVNVGLYWYKADWEGLEDFDLESYEPPSFSAVIPVSTEKKEYHLTRSKKARNA